MTQHDICQYFGVIRNVEIRAPAASGGRYTCTIRGDDNSLTLEATKADVHRVVKLLTTEAYERETPTLADWLAANP